MPLIKKTKYNHEEIRIKLIYELLNLGYFISAEGYIHCYSRYLDRVKLVYDLGIHKTEDSKPSLLIEIKRVNFKDSNLDKEWYINKHPSRQRDKYNNVNIPWIYCLGMDDIPRVLEFIKDQITL